MLVYTSSYRECTFRIVKRSQVIPLSLNDPKNIYLDSFICLPDDLPFVQYCKKGYSLRQLFAPKMRTLTHAGDLHDIPGFWIAHRALPHESMYTHGLNWAKSLCRCTIGYFLDDDYGILHKNCDASKLRFVKPIGKVFVSLPITTEEEE